MLPNQYRYRWREQPGWRRHFLGPMTLLWVLMSLGLSSCSPAEQSATAGPPGQGQGGGGGPRSERGGGNSDQPAVVEILKATSGGLDDGESYTGSTEPRQQIEVKSQLTAEILSLSLAVGDRVTQGEVIAQLDPKLLRATLGEAEAELAVRQAELSQARSSATTAAILKAAPQRLRPILMTTLTTVLGLLPLALGIGEGSEFLQPLGVVVFSGLSFATLLTLFVIPCFYTLLHGMFKRSRT